MLYLLSSGIGNTSSQYLDLKPKFFFLGLEIISLTLGCGNDVFQTT